MKEDEEQEPEPPEPFEWTEDWFHNTYDEAPTDGSAWNDPPGADTAASKGMSQLATLATIS